jgi:uncharacterized protein (TIGR02145 family)
MIMILTNSCEKFSDDEPITDIEGNIYETVKIYRQVWMTENLKVTKFNDGTSITLVPDSATWMDLETPAYCWYNNDSTSYKEPYGALYNFYAVNTGKLCPTGWHVPTEEEWYTLISKLDAKHEPFNYFGITSFTAGGKLKEAGTTHWYSTNQGATNETGFTALPGGSRSYYPFTGGEIGWTTSPETVHKNSDGYYDIGYIAHFWSSTYITLSPTEEGKGGGSGGMRSTLYRDNNWVVRDQFGSNNGLSIRCVKD